MARVKNKNTKPEKQVRYYLTEMGYRYRLHVANLPGRPDLVFSKRRKAIFVHGCFWHRHPGCSCATMPKSRTEFWQAKFAANVARDAKREAELQSSGWHVEVIWECECRNSQVLKERLAKFLGPTSYKLAEI